MGILCLHTHDGCRQIHHGELFVDDLLDGDRVILFRLRIELRIAVVDAVDGLGQAGCSLPPSRWRGVRCPCPLRNTDARFRRQKRQPFLSRSIYSLRSLENSFVMEPHSNGVKNLRLHPCVPENLRNIDTVHDWWPTSRSGRPLSCSMASLVRPRQKLPPPMTIPTWTPVVHGHLDLSCDLAAPCLRQSPSSSALPELLRSALKIRASFFMACKSPMSLPWRSRATAPVRGSRRRDLSPGFSRCEHYRILSGNCPEIYTVRAGKRGRSDKLETISSSLFSSRSSSGDVRIPDIPAGAFLPITMWPQLSALPHGLLGFLEYLLHLHVVKELQVSLLVGLLDGGHARGTWLAIAAKPSCLSLLCELCLYMSVHS